MLRSDAAAMAERPGSIVTLDSGEARVTVVPEAGAALGSYALRIDEALVPLMRPGPAVPDPEDPFSLACNLLLPWSNRISGGGFTFAGAFHVLAPNLAGESSPIHGDAFQRPWSLEACDRTTAVLVLSDGGVGPFHYDATVTWRLEGATLAVELMASNRATVSLPYGVGLHPWFVRTPGAMLRLPADGVRLEDKRYLPAGSASLDQVPEWDFRTLKRLPDGWINNAFTGWPGNARLEWPLIELAAVGGCDALNAERTARVQLDILTPDSLTSCIVHSPDSRSAFVCVEPVSHTVDAHNASDPVGEGLRVLAPGESMEVHCRFEPVVRG